MRETIIISIIITCYLFLSYKFQNIFLKAGNIAFILFCILYLIPTYLYFELINQAEIFLRNKKIYLEFGHANIVMLEVMLLCFLFALVNIAIAIFRRYKRKRIW
jgi:hypothetical protein